VNYLGAIVIRHSLFVLFLLDFPYFSPPTFLILPVAVWVELKGLPILRNTCSCCGCAQLVLFTCAPVVGAAVSTEPRCAQLYPQQANHKYYKFIAT
jgi:hypothetical protein